MTGTQADTDQRQRFEALSTWDGEGGAGPLGPQESPSVLRELAPAIDGTETAHLHVRMIALENLVLALLATASRHQLQLARDMADLILPRQGFTQHPLTIHAAAHMDALVGRAERYVRAAGDADDAETS